MFSADVCRKIESEILPNWLLWSKMPFLYWCACQPLLLSGWKKPNVRKSYFAEGKCGWNWQSPKLFPRMNPSQKRREANWFRTECAAPPRWHNTQAFDPLWPGDQHWLTANFHQSSIWWITLLTIYSIFLHILPRIKSKDTCETKMVKRCVGTLAFCNVCASQKGGWLVAGGGDTLQPLKRNN